MIATTRDRIETAIIVALTLAELALYADKCTGGKVTRKLVAAWELKREHAALIASVSADDIANEAWLWMCWDRRRREVRGDT